MVIMYFTLNVNFVNLSSFMLCKAGSSAPIIKPMAFSLNVADCTVKLLTTETQTLKSTQL